MTSNRSRYQLIPLRHNISCACHPLEHCGTAQINRSIPMPFHGLVSQYREPMARAHTTTSRAHVFQRILALQFPRLRLLTPVSVTTARCQDCNLAPEKAKPAAIKQSLVTYSILDRLLRTVRPILISLQNTLARQD